MPTYQSAWLKTHFPTEFLAGIMTHDPGMYPRRLLLAEARRLGVKLLPVDINKSSREFHVEKIGKETAIRMSFVDLHSISEKEIDRIMANQPFRDITDVYLRAKPSRRTFENLAQIGALDSLAKGGTRGDVLAKVKELNGIKKRVDEDNSLFDEVEILPKGNPEPSNQEKVETELNLLGMDITEHVLEKYRPMLEALGVVYSRELVDLRNKTNVLVAGVRVATQTPPMRSGKRVVAQKRCSHLLFNTRMMLIAGKVRRTGPKGVSIMAENAWRLDELWEQWCEKAKMAPEFSDAIFLEAI